MDRLSGAAAEALHRTGSAAMTSLDVVVLQDALLTAGVNDEMEKLILRHVEDACLALTDEALHPAGVAGLMDRHQGFGVAYVLSSPRRAGQARLPRTNAGHN